MSGKGPVLVVGATGNVGGQVVEVLRQAGAPVRALARRPEAAGLPDDVEVVAGDLTAPESLAPALDGVDAAFLLWTAPPATAEEVVGRIAARARRIVLLSSPHQTPHPFFQQPNIGEALGRRLRLEELSPDGFRDATAGRWPERAVEMLLAAGRHARTPGVRHLHRGRGHRALPRGASAIGRATTPTPSARFGFDDHGRVRRVDARAARG